MQKRVRTRVFLAAMVSLFSAAPMQVALSATTENQGKWKSIPGPSRFYHTATLLKNGKVLIAGGCPEVTSNTCVKVTDQSLLFDPGTNRWSTASKMTSPRAAHAAVRLPDGKVLAVGGCAQRNSFICLHSLDSAEVYDPSRGRWAPVPGPGRAITLDFFPSQPALLPSGELGCGSNCGKVVLATTVSGAFHGRVFDSRKRSWEEITPPEPKDVPLLPTTTVLADGRVLMHGAGLPTAPGQPAAHANSLVYTPSSNTWAKAGGSPLINRSIHSATLLKDGTVLAAGGFSSQAEQTSEVFTPFRISRSSASASAGTWRALGPLGRPRLGHVAVRLPDGKVMIAGGREKLGEGLADTELYNPATRSWAPGPAMRNARGGQTTGEGPPVAIRDTGASLTATTLQNKSLLVVGGSPSKTAEVFEPGGARLGAGEGQSRNGLGRAKAISWLKIAAGAGAIALIVLVSILAGRRLRRV